MTPTDDKPEGSDESGQRSNDMVRGAAAELYAGALSDFITTRTSLVKTAKAEGHKDTAKEIAALRKPSVAAWVLNQLVHGGAPVIQALADLGSRLRRATARLDAQAIADLRGERDTVLADLVAAAAETSNESGQKLSSAVESEVRNTGIAALADEAAEAVLASGTLTRALSYSGFGEVDLSEAAATTSTGVVLTSIRGGRSATKAGAEPPDEDSVDAASADEEGDRRADQTTGEPENEEQPDGIAADAAEDDATGDEVVEDDVVEDDALGDEALGDEAEDGVAENDETGDDEAGDDEAEDDGADALAEAAAAEELERRRDKASDAVEQAQREVGRRRAALEAARNRTDATRQRVQKLDEQLVKARAEDDQALEAMAEAISAAKRADADLTEAKDLLERLADRDTD